eukprot:symbB.v1.2.032484.t1/scaffold3904.1/size48501/6
MEDQCFMDAVSFHSDFHSKLLKASCGFLSVRIFDSVDVDLDIPCLFNAHCAARPNHAKGMASVFDGMWMYFGAFWCKCLVFGRGQRGHQEQDLLYRRLGADKFSKLLDEAEVITKKFQDRIKKARGFFQTANGIIWHVTPEGEVKGLHADGSKIRDRIQVTDDNTLQIGPFRLDEERSCSCIHWMRKDDPEKAWNWSRDNSLRTRVRLGTGERA